MGILLSIRASCREVLWYLLEKAGNLEISEGPCSSSLVQMVKMLACHYHGVRCWNWGSPASIHVCASPKNVSEAGTKKNTESSEVDVAKTHNKYHDTCDE